MSENNYGGPAFPQPSCPDCGVQHEPEHVPGMSLRDYFAAKVLPVAMRDFYGDCKDGDATAWDGHDDVAEHCYLVADAMLKARAK